MIPYGRQSVNPRDVAAVIRALKSDFITQGPSVAEFESAIARSAGTRYAVAVANGTAALHVAYLAAGIKAGDEVITTPNTFAATANMLLAIGAKPVFCDIRLDTYNIDEKKIEKLITKRTKAIVPVHFAGQSCEMDAIRKIAKKHRLLVIADGAHAIGATYRGKKIGAVADMTTFSFHPVKPITTAEGGAIVTNNKKWYEAMCILRHHGMSKDRSGNNVMSALGYNYRLSDIHAALGVSQLKRLATFAKKRRAIVKRYRTLFTNINDIILPASDDAISASAWHLFPVLVPASKRNRIVAALRRKGVGIQIHYPPVYTHAYYRQLGYRPKRCPNAETFAASEISLPLFPDLTTRGQEHVVRALREALYSVR